MAPAPGFDEERSDEEPSGGARRQPYKKNPGAGNRHSRISAFSDAKREARNAKMRNAVSKIFAERAKSGGAAAEKTSI